MSEEIRKYQTEQGIPLFYEKRPGSQVASLVVGVRAGRAWEGEEKKGVSHFLEHMVFNGSKNYPDPTMSLDEKGIIINGMTNYLYTYYPLWFRRDHLETAFTILHDMLTEPLFNNFTKERETVREEISWADDETDWLLGEAVSRAAYRGEMGGEIRGTRDSVASTKKEDLDRYFKKRYTAPNIVISLVGDFEEKEIKQILTKALWADGESSEKYPVEKYSPGGSFYCREKELKQYNFCLTTPLFGRSDSRFTPFSYLSYILGYGMSSRLWREIRDKRGLSYAVGGYAKFYKESGVFRAKASVSQENLHEAMKITRNEILRLREEEIEEAEFQKAREMLLGDLVIAQDDSYGRAIDMTIDLIHGKEPLSLNEEISLIKSVKRKELLPLAEELFNPNNLSLAVVGPSGDFAKETFRDIFAR